MRTAIRCAAQEAIRDGALHDIRGSMYHHAVYLFTVTCTWAYISSESHSVQGAIIHSVRLMIKPAESIVTIAWNASYLSTWAQSGRCAGRQTTKDMPDKSYTPHKASAIKQTDLLGSTAAAFRKEVFKFLRPFTRTSTIAGMLPVSCKLEENAWSLSLLQE